MILRNGNLEDDGWVRLGDDAPVEGGVPVIVSLDRWRDDHQSLALRSAPVGVFLRPDQPPTEILGDLERLATVAFEMPVFKDGRVFSHARLLRERYNFRGDVRVFGHVLRDQYLFLDRCGVNVIEVDGPKAAEDWASAMTELSVVYQPAADNRRPIPSLRRDAFDRAGERGDNAKADARVRLFSHTYGHLSAQNLLAEMIHTEFAGRIALVSSFGSEAAILLHMVAGIDPALPVVLLDTRKLFGETLRYRDLLVDRLGLTNVRSEQPDAAEVARRDADGMLWQRDGDACCSLRKVEPLERALSGVDAWITGRKRYQGARRAVLPVIEASAGRIKINPLASWTRDLVDEYFAEHDLPRHPLEEDGFRSIGCMPCTDRIAHGEDLRAGRWRGRSKMECGIHETPASQSLTSSGL
ncbi:MAG: phosphoadenylyl-sulfate reductase [Proteobacteria bacterium]|nr:phosphoadenylyl-sulfate reductase [Pseudomonadota bacterium]MDA1132026.1 phosphoadenylyl-sulfate reductase [Pseudomonadota bacterium]